MSPIVKKKPRRAPRKPEDPEKRRERQRAWYAGLSREQLDLRAARMRARRRRLGPMKRPAPAGEPSWAEVYANEQAPPT